MITKSKSKSNFVTISLLLSNSAAAAALTTLLSTSDALKITSPSVAQFLPRIDSLSQQSTTATTIAAVTASILPLTKTRPQQVS